MILVSFSGHVRGDCQQGQTLRWSAAMQSFFWCLMREGGKRVDGYTQNGDGGESWWPLRFGPDCGRDSKMEFYDGALSFLDFIPQTQG